MSADAKLDNLILAVAGHPGVRGLGKTKLWKLIYFIEASLLREYGSNAGVGFVKQPFGPVPARGQRRLDALTKAGRILVTKEAHDVPYAQQNVSTTIKPPPDAFTAAEKAIIDKVCTAMGRQTAATLSKISHDEPAWIHAGIGKDLDPVLMAYGAKEDPEGL